MTYINPQIHNVLMRQALAEHAASRGIEIGEYAFNPHANKMRYRDHEGAEIIESVNKILAERNMRDNPGRKAFPNPAWHGPKNRQS